jgi:hypothetical protein
MNYYNLAEYLTLQECKHGYLYEIECRNLRIGVYNENTKSFYGIRTKFSSRFIDDEYHWDLGSPYGTCKPVKELEVCPIPFEGEIPPVLEEYKEYMSKWRHQNLTNSDKLFEWLDKKLNEIHSSNS